MKTLLLIDANSLIRRFFHALPPLTNGKGEPVQAVYGLSNLLLKMWREGKNPDFAAVCYDRPEPTFRKEQYEGYKAQRPPTPEGLLPQLDESRELFKLFGLRTFEAVGMEADDLIATLTEKFHKQKDVQIVILTGDSDLFQLVEDDKVVVRTFKTGISDTVLYNYAAVRERYGLEPSQLLDYKALVGDASDNIKGVPGIGPKTATRLLQDYGSLAKLYKNLAKEPKLKEKLEDNLKGVELAQMLLTLKRDVPIELEKIDELAIKEFEVAALKHYLQEQGFESLVKRLASAEEGDSVVTGKTGASRSVKGKTNIKTGGGAGGGSASGGSLFEKSPETPLPKLNVKKPAEGVLIITEDEEQRETFIKDYTSTKIKVGFNLKELLQIIWLQGKDKDTGKDKDIAPPYFDLGIAYWLLDPDFKQYDPEMIFRRFFKRQWKGDETDYEVAFDYARGKLQEALMAKIFDDIEMPTLRILAEMERWGAELSVKKLQILEKNIEKDITRLTAEIYARADGEFNINSPQQLGKVLFEKLGLKSGARKSTGHLSTNVDVLNELLGAHPIIPLILEYREDFKIQSTYVKALQQLVREDGRLHTHFIQTGTGTGRISSQAPNLQNIPQESKWSQAVRSAFEAPRGTSLVSFDYSQLELRLLAEITGDKEMVQAFKNNIDIHSLTASKVLHVPLDQVTKQQRRLAKVLNFGLAYGMGIVAFSKVSGLKRSEAKEFIEAYFHEFSRIKEWQEETKQEVRINGYAQTLTGRRRYFPAIRSPLSYIAAEAERAAINHPVQGLEADITKLAMIQTKAVLEEKNWWGTKAKMILCIHDELLFEIDDAMIEVIAPQIRRSMEGVYPALSVPLRVDMKHGKDWGHMEVF